MYGLWNWSLRSLDEENSSSPLGSVLPGLTFGELGDRTLAKGTLRIIPVICLRDFVAFLDNWNNVGFAKLTMSEDIGL